MKKFMIFVGAITTGVAAGLLVKKCLQKDAEEDDSDVSSVRIYEDEGDQTSDENSDDADQTSDESSEDDVVKDGE